MARKYEGGDKCEDIRCKEARTHTKQWSARVIDVEMSIKPGEDSGAEGGMEGEVVRVKEIL